MQKFIYIIGAFCAVTDAIRELPYMKYNPKASDEEMYELKVTMPLTQTKEPNKYMCYSKSLDEIGESYVSSILTEADKSSAHHVDTGICTEPQQKDTYWECERGLACKGEAVDFGSWDNFFSKTTPFFKLPKDVSVKVGGRKKSHYLIIQVHFSKPAYDPVSPANVTIKFGKIPTSFHFQKYMLTNHGTLPANKPKGYFSYVGCEWKRPPAFAFKYYVHTHNHGVFAEGFLIRNKTWVYIGGQLTQERLKSQFDVVNGPIEIKTGDILAARCLYVNQENKAFRFGFEESCTFQLGIGYDIQYQEHFSRPPACVSNSPEFNFCDHEQTAALCAS